MRDEGERESGIKRKERLVGDRVMTKDIWRKMKIENRKGDKQKKKEEKKESSKIKNKIKLIENKDNIALIISIVITWNSSF